MLNVFSIQLAIQSMITNIESASKVILEYFPKDPSSFSTEEDPELLTEALQFVWNFLLC